MLVFDFLFVLFFDRISCSVGWLWASYVAKDDPEDELLILLTPPLPYPVHAVLGIEPRAMCLLGKNSIN